MLNFAESKRTDAGCLQISGKRTISRSSSTPSRHNVVCTDGLSNNDFAVAVDKIHERWLDASMSCPPQVLWTHLAVRRCCTRC